MMFRLPEIFSDFSDLDFSDERGPRMIRARLPSRHPTGLYVHSSPPTVVPVQDSVVRGWLRGGEMGRLKELVLEGEGAALLGEYSPDPGARAFVRALPRILSRIEEAHRGAAEGDIDRVDRAVRRERSLRVELSKDPGGLSLLHKAVLRGHGRLQEWLLTNYPELVHLTDREGRTALHYAGSSERPKETWRRLSEAGADPELRDSRGFTPAYYMEHPRRARPPRPRGGESKSLPSTVDKGLVVKPANIRIWIHDRDLGRLQRVLWEGQGSKLLSETCSQPKVRRFLAAVPYILGSIRDVHKAAIENDVETLRKKTADPVPRDILLSKDINGLNPLHKAAGLGNEEAVSEILGAAREAARGLDNQGRSPLHYAALNRSSQPPQPTAQQPPAGEGGATPEQQQPTGGVEGNTTPGDRIYQLLLQAGAPEHLQDKKGRTASYYRWKPGELESSRGLLGVIPDAPRTAHIFPPNWDWRLLQPSSHTARQDSTDALSPQNSTSEELSKSDQGGGLEEAKPTVEVSEDEGVGSENAQSVEDNPSPQNGDQLDVFDGDEEASDIPKSRSELFGEDSGAIEISELETPDETEGRLDQSLQNEHENEGNTGSPEEETKVKNESDDDKKNMEETTNDIPETIPPEQNLSSNIEQPDETILNKDADDTVNNPITKQENMKTDEEPLGETINSSKSVEDNVENKMEEATNFVENNPAPILVRSDTVVLKKALHTKIENANNELYADDDLQETTNENVIEHYENLEEQKEEETATNKAKDLKKENANSSKSRQSLKSRALKAIELGRGRVNLSLDKEETRDEGNVANKEEEKYESEESKDAEYSEENIESSRNEDINEKGNLEEATKGEDKNSHSKVTNEKTKEEETDHVEKQKEDGDMKLEEPSNEVSKDGEDSQTENEPSASEEHFPDSLEDIRTKSGEKQTEAIETTVDSKAENTTNNELANSSLSSENYEELRRAAEGLVASADMEGMAEMVLSGEGRALLDLASDNPDVQLFINNVPQYMAKIERVHKASREGDLRGVQTSLDRRKFAVARDNGTRLKPTPLHVAVLFGRTSVLRYLAGRFPETMHATDSSGRSPLHYATTLPDNGHFYSLLITLGADKTLQDNMGRTAEYYLRNRDELTREMLLGEYQDRAVPIDMSGLNFNRYSDKGAEILREGYPIFNPEEGQYLASTLGDPLIKGLTDVAALRPSNPITHLAHFLLAYQQSGNQQEDKKGVRSIEGTPPGKMGEGSHDESSGRTSETAEEEAAESLAGGAPREEEPQEREEAEERQDEDEDIDVIENDEVERDSPEPSEAFKPVNRDEHGQSMLHFAAANSHGRNAMYQLLQEMDANPGLRDSLYRTARDIAEQARIPDNIKGIDRYVVSLAARGEEDKLVELLLEGYDHILDAEDGGNILSIVEDRGNESMLQFLKKIPQFEKNREKLHRAIRFGSLSQVQEIFNKSDSKRRLATAKNGQGRGALHVAVLAQHEPTVEYIANKYPATLQLGDNLMRTPLHYAMALDKVESLSKILIAAGAQRVLKDLKGRQPSYYFMNKTDIQKLQDEEEALRV